MLFNNRIANADADADANANANANVDADADPLDTIINNLNSINDDYDYCQTYFYIFLFVCLITGIIFVLSV